MRVMFSGLRYNYGRPWEGDSYEFVQFHLAWRDLCMFRGWPYEPLWFEEVGRPLEPGRAAGGADARLIEAAERFRPDLFFIVLFEQDVTPTALRAVRALGTTVVTWGCDDVKRWDNYSREYAVAATAHVTVDPETVAKAAAAGQPHCLVSHWAANPGFFRRPMANEDSAQRWDVSFVGQRHSDRSAYVDALRAEYGDRFRVVGSGWGSGSYVTWEEVRQTFWATKVNLNLANLAAAGTTEQMKGRHFELAMTGACQLSSAVSRLDDYFEEGKEVAVFRGGVDGMLAEIRRLVDDDDLRRWLGHNARQRAIYNHTWADRYDAIIRELRVRGLLDV